MVLLCTCSSISWAQESRPQSVGENQAKNVENVRLWHSPDRTRVVFDVSENVTYSIFSLEGPRRLVVDIENANLSIRLPSLDPDNQHVSEIRFGRPENKVLRFVFELKKPLHTTDFVLSPNELYGHRLVVDIEDPLASSLISDFAQLGSTSSADDAQNQAGPTPEVGIQRQDSGANENPAGSDSAPTKDGEIIQSGNIQTSVVSDAPAFKVTQAPQRSGPLTIAIDAGHGGEDPGALGYRGSREKNITLAIAKRLKAIVDEDPRMRSFMVRKGDYYIELHKRRQMARAAKADIFISIHADAFTKKSARGLSVFALSQSGATSAMAKALATKENASDQIGGVSLADKDAVLARVLVDLSMNNTISESVNFGGRVLNELKGLGKLHSRRVEQAGFEVLKSADIPSILIETGFITNPDEERKLKSPGYQDKVATAIHSAINSYFNQTPFFSNARFAGTSHRGSDYKSLVTPKSKVGVKAKRNRRSPTTSSGVLTHRVVRGDSLSKIAEKYGISIANLKSTNNLKSNTVVLGQRLKLPRSRVSNSSTKNRPAEHVVARGDSLSKISSRYNVTIRALKSANNLRRDTVVLGQKLQIPGGRTSSKPVTHKVKRGDTLSEIASLYGSSMSKIMRANSLSSRSVMLGQILKIPN